MVLLLLKTHFKQSSKLTLNNLYRQQNTVDTKKRVFLRVIYISFYSLAFRTRIDAVELIVKKHLLLWWSFCVLEVTFAV